MITITENAVKQLQAAIGEDPARAGKALRIHVEEGGCAGKQYAMSFDAPKSDDAVAERGGVRVLVDPQSLPFVDGATIDYHDDLAGSGFRIHNPNAARSCGCGTSFESGKA